MLQQQPVVLARMTAPSVTEHPEARVFTWDSPDKRYRKRYRPQAFPTASDLKNEKVWKDKEFCYDGSGRTYFMIPPEYEAELKVQMGDYSFRGELVFVYLLPPLCKTKQEIREHYTEALLETRHWDVQILHPLVEQPHDPWGLYYYQPRLQGGSFQGRIQDVKEIDDRVGMIALQVNQATADLWGLPPRTQLHAEKRQHVDTQYRPQNREAVGVRLDGQSLMSAYRVREQPQSMMVHPAMTSSLPMLPTVQPSGSPLAAGFHLLDSTNHLWSAPPTGAR